MELACCERDVWSHDAGRSMSITCHPDLVGYTAVHTVLYGVLRVEDKYE